MTDRLQHIPYLGYVNNKHFLGKSEKLSTYQLMSEWHGMYSLKSTNLS